MLWWTFCCPVVEIALILNKSSVYEEKDSPNFAIAGKRRGDGKNVNFAVEKTFTVGLSSTFISWMAYFRSTSTVK